MKIDLAPPYSDRWKNGYLQSHPSGRKYVCLFNSRKDRSIVSYARYLMAVKLGRFLDKSEHVDHKDEDKSNDHPDNLQILTQAENNEKNQKARLKAIGKDSFWVILNCPECDSDFIRRPWSVNKAMSENKVLTCSRSCSSKYQFKLNGSRSPRKKEMSDLHSGLIRSLREEGKSDYVISDLIGLSRAKIQRFRQENGIL
ncbi:hypothetical protein D9M68_19690 [compost metagenome]